MEVSAKPIAIDVFSGVGGLSLGFHRAGFQIAASFDVDPINVKTYSKNFPKTRSHQADVSELSGAGVRRLAGLAESGDIDVVFGGPPCQGFSLIGKRLLDDPRNQLLIEFARLISELNPRYFVIENVAGLMLGQARLVLARTLRILRKAGYRWASPIRILDSSDYGVPQIRKRVIVLGYRSDQPRLEYPKKSHGKITVRHALRDMYSIGRRKSLLRSDHFAGKLGASTAYSKKLSRGHLRLAPLTGCQLCHHTPTVIRRFKDTRPGTSEPVSRFPRLHLGRPAPTLRAGTGSDKGSFTAARPIHPTQPRCITVREAARIHSFPDWFEFHPTQWHGFRQVGNSVPPLLSGAVARSIVAAMTRTGRENE
jgi:DNA (cytosine-5)-methyltransferase 1